MARGLVWPELLKVLWALAGEVAPKKEVVDCSLGEEGARLVLLLGVEHLAEVKAS